MHHNIFSPRVQEIVDDGLSVFFYKSAQTILVVVFGLLPLFFLPGIYTTLGFMKALFVVIGIYLALILACLAMLRSGKLRIYLPLPLLLFWFFAIMAVASAMLSGDAQDALFGAAFDTNSAGFFVLMAAVMTMSLVFVDSKSAVTKLFLTSSVVVLLVYAFTLVRLLMGPDFLSFGIFTSNLVSLVGSLNDLALYAGLVLLITMIVAYKMPDKVVPKLLAAILVFSSLFILALVNFSYVWLAMAFFSLLTFLYLVSKDTWLKTPADTPAVAVSRFTLSLVALICLVSGAFVVSGDYLGAKVAEFTGVNYLEVRPSLSATLAITRAVYKENILFGIGPNRFEDAWRTHKDPVINETQFWNTTFTGGNSFLMSLFITTGLLGIILFGSFLLAFLYVGYRLFFVIKFPDATWQLLGLVTFFSACYLWLMTSLYAPGAFIMFLAAIMTGLSLAVGATAAPERAKLIDVVHNRQYGFLLIASVLVVIITATTLFIAINKQFMAHVLFTEGGREFATSLNLAEFDQVLERAARYNDRQDIYVAERARLRLTELNRLLTVPEPTVEEKQSFDTTLVEGIQFAEQAIGLDQTNPYNYALLGSFYGLINPTLYEGVLERREKAFEQARRYDPTNPEYLALQAQLVAQHGELASARTYLTEAVRLKGNYTDALFLLSQLDIQEGNATSAIATTLSIIALEPYNPGRYFQLGLLRVATNDVPGAIEAFEAAISLDTDYANARYLLALAYLDSGRVKEAIEQLKIVQVSNQDNAELKTLIAQIEGGDYTNPPLGYEVPVKDESGAVSSDEVTTTTKLPDSSLIAPVNRVPRNPDESVVEDEEPAPGTEAVPNEAAAEGQ